MHLLVTAGVAFTVQMSNPPISHRKVSLLEIVLWLWTDLALT